MKLALVLLLFAAPALAQNSPSQAQSSPQGPCGPEQTQFDVERSPSHPSVQAEPGKALIYISEVFKKAAGEMGGDPTLRVAVDGEWVGAVKGNSSFAFSVEPGEHHLCVKWQSHFKRLSRGAAFTVFTAEAGKPYYFRARVNYDVAPSYGHTGNDITGMSITLDAISPDEGQYLVGTNPISVPRQKK